LKQNQEVQEVQGILSIQGNRHLLWVLEVLENQATREVHLFQEDQALLSVLEALELLVLMKLRV
jgi:hypothetical protein